MSTRPASSKPRPFLGVRFVTCQTYGRLYRNKEATAYTGRCPRCGKHYAVRIAEGGSCSRFFLAHCR